jgi:two-component sensor histidine kinase/DNA-binding response OmpR family regulator
MEPGNKINILLVDDQPAKLLSYEAILDELGENLIKATSGRQALEHLLRTEIAVILMDVNMPELDGFQLAAMIREHPRFRETAIIFVSAINLAEVDHLRGYEMGAVDYVPIPVVPQVLRAKVRVFAELFRKTRQLERLNAELEDRVTARTRELEATARRLLESERRRNLALAAGRMGSWDWDVPGRDCIWDEGQHAICGVDPASFSVSLDGLRAIVHPDDWSRLEAAAARLMANGAVEQVEFRIRRPDGEIRWCIGTAAGSSDAAGKIERVSGVTLDITERKLAEERQFLLAREIDHRAKNVLAVAQAIVRLTRADNMRDYVHAVEHRIRALARAHSLLSESGWRGVRLQVLVQEEMAPYLADAPSRVTASGPDITLDASLGQMLALTLHELATNAAKHGALASAAGKVAIAWEVRDGRLHVNWAETGGPSVVPPSSTGFGTKMLRASIERQPGGEFRQDWLPGGLACAFSIPFASEPPAVARIDPAVAKDRPGRAGRVLLAEDEALVALMMTELLGELGYETVGPFTDVASAREAASMGDFHAAVLDVNLNGKLIYPVAELLAARKVPIVFTTGYEVDTIDPRFQDAAILRKPIERQDLRDLLVNGVAKSEKRES